MMHESRALRISAIIAAGGTGSSGIGFIPANKAFVSQKTNYKYDVSFPEFPSISILFTYHIQPTIRVQVSLEPSSINATIKIAFKALRNKNKL
jgi:hypothetical protein